MTSPYSQVIRYHFVYPLPNIYGADPDHDGAWKSVIYKVGTKRGPGDARNFLLPRTYRGLIARGRVVSPAPVLIYSYYPTPEDNIYPCMSATRWSGIPDGQVVLNKAYDRYISDIRQGAEAGIGVDIAEGHQVSSMFGSARERVRTAANVITRSCTKAGKAYKQLRRGNLPKFAEVLGITLKRRHRRDFRRAVSSRRKRSIMRKYSHQASELWLEYHFGWEPLVNDIYSATVILGQDPVRDSRPVRGVSHRWFSETRGAGSTGDYVRKGVTSAKITGVVRSMVRVTNPNFANNTRLGLNNPQTLLWELLPFSFVVDWFSNVGQVLDSWSDLWGYKLSYPSFTIYARGTADGYYGRTNVAHIQWKFNHVHRTAATYKPTLQLPNFSNFGHSVKRAATAVSLLISVFTGK